MCHRSGENCDGLLRDRTFEASRSFPGTTRLLSRNPSFVEEKKELEMIRWLEISFSIGRTWHTGEIVGGPSTDMFASVAHPRNLIHDRTKKREYGFCDALQATQIVPK
jgi:hypothetical protein